MNVSVDVELIRARLVDLGWTQADLAEDTGLSKRTVEGILSRKTASLDSVHRIARAVGVEVAAIRGQWPRGAGCDAGEVAGDSANGYQPSGGISADGLPVEPPPSHPLVANFHAHSQRQWDGMWNPPGGVGPAGRRPQFVEAQGIRLLRKPGIAGVYQDPRPYLRPEHFRGLPGLGGVRESESPYWRTVARDEIVRQFTETHAGDRWARSVIATDAGVGKTTNMRWLSAALNAPGSPVVAILFDVAALLGTPGDVVRLLVDHFRRAAGNAEPVPRGEVELLLLALRREGRLVLLIDALDQVDAADLSCVKTLLHVLGDDNWAQCPIVLGSRPFALERDWDALFPNMSAAVWQFLRVEEFTPGQQEAYLGADRYGRIPPEARSVLSIPRVLYYLLASADDEIGAIESPSDVYRLATDKLLVDGLRARGADGCTPSQARLVLSAIAFEMTIRAKNFHAVVREEMDGFVRRVAGLCRSIDREYGLDWTEGKIRQVVAMNEFLSHAILEAGCPLRLQWRNRSLQEFFAGLWFSKYASETDTDAVWRAKFIAGRPATEDFREAWRFATEMPTSLRTPDVWVRSMACLYTHRVRGKAGIERSTEMIYRSWRVMSEYANLGPGAGKGRSAAAASALDAFSQFRNEFRSFVEGRHGPRGRRIARQLLDSFVRVPPAADTPMRFRMGSPKGESRRSRNERRHWATITSALEMSRYPVTVEQYELFDPNHGGRAHRYRWRKRYPAVYITWYDAWVFAKWIGDAYRLPTEAEWEYACRSGSSAPYCFGSDRAKLRLYAHFGGYHNNLLRPIPVGCLRPNAWGLHDMHGSCWEWCETWYHDNSEVGGQAHYVGNYRTVRGGSCTLGSWRVRSATREARHPRDMHPTTGFRICRTTPEGSAR